MVHIWDATGSFGLRGTIDHSLGSVYSLAVTRHFIIVGRFFTLLTSSFSGRRFVCNTKRLSVFLITPCMDCWSMARVTPPSPPMKGAKTSWLVRCPGSSSRRGPCVVFLGTTLLSQCSTSPRCTNEYYPRVETTTMSTWRHKRGTSFSWTMSCKLLFFLSFHFLRTRFSIKRLFCFLCLITLPTLPPLTGTYNQNIHVYDVNSYQSIKALVGHIGTVTGLAPAVAGKLLFSASYDTTVQVQSRDTFIVTAKY